MVFAERSRPATAMPRETTPLPAFEQLARRLPIRPTSKDLDAFEDRCMLLSSLRLAPLPVLYCELGLDALVWTWMNTGDPGFNKSVKSFLASVGFDAERMEKAKWAVFNLCRYSDNNTTTSVVSFYRLITEIYAIIERLPIANLTGQFLSDSVQKRINQYSFEALETRNHEIRGRDRKWSRWNRYEPGLRMYLESPIGFTLLYNGTPAAFASLLVFDTELRIMSWQGARPYYYVKGDDKPIYTGHSRGLIGIGWKPLFAQLVEYIALQLGGITHVGLTSAYNLYWTTERYNDGTYHFPLDRALKAYDEVAHALHFVQGEDRNWRKPVLAP